jgi:hypothetical protein
VIGDYPAGVKRQLLLVVAVVAVLIGVAYSAVVARGRMKDAEARQCRESVAAAAQEVHTERWYPPEELLDLGNYPEIHWQVRGSLHCAGIPDVTDHRHQGVVRLRPEDARALASRMAAVRDDAENAASAVPVQVWPGLAGFVPAGVRWQHSRRYDEAQQLERRRQLYVDPKSAIALFVITER